jgi:hypothetical protein
LWVSILIFKSAKSAFTAANAIFLFRTRIFTLDGGHSAGTSIFSSFATQNYFPYLHNRIEASLRSTAIEMNRFPVLTDAQWAHRGWQSRRTNIQERIRVRMLSVRPPRDAHGFLLPCAPLVISMRLCYNARLRPKRVPTPATMRNAKCEIPFAAAYGRAAVSPLFYFILVVPSGRQFTRLPSPSISFHYPY